MSRHRLFQPLGERQLDLVRTRIARSHEDWHRRWFQGRVRTLDLRCEAVAPGVASGQQDWTGYESAGKRVCARLVGASEPQVLMTWTGADRPPRAEDPVGSRMVVQRVLGDWISRWMVASSVVPAHDLKIAPATLPADWTQPFSGAVKATLDTWFGGLEWVIDPAIVGALRTPGPQADQSRPKCAARSAAVHGAPVVVEITCDVAAAFSLRSLEELQVGDVVLLDADSASPWKVIAGDQEVALGYPGRAGSHRAVSLKNRSAN